MFFSMAVLLMSSFSAFCGVPAINLNPGDGETKIESIVIKTDESNLEDLQKMAADFDKTHQIKECQITLNANVKMGIVEVGISVTVSAATCSEATNLALQGLSDAKRAVMNSFY